MEMTEDMIDTKIRRLWELRGRIEDEFQGDLLWHLLERINDLQAANQVLVNDLKNLRSATERESGTPDESWREAVRTPFASCYRHEQATERLRQINTITYEAGPFKPYKAMPDDDRRKS